MTAIFSSAVLTSMTWVLMIGGTVAALRAIRRAVGEMRRAPRDPERAFALICGFRRAMIGCCVAALGIGLYFESPAIIGLALIICAEETLESSTVIAALKRDVFGVRAVSSPPAAGGEQKRGRNRARENPLCISPRGFVR